MIGDITFVLTNARGLTQLTLSGLGIMNRVSWDTDGSRRDTRGRGLCLCKAREMVHGDPRQLLQRRRCAIWRWRKMQTIPGTRQAMYKSTSCSLCTGANLEDRYSDEDERERLLTWEMRPYHLLIRKSFPLCSGNKFCNPTKQGEWPEAEFSQTLRYCSAKCAPFEPEGGLQPM